MQCLNQNKRTIYYALLTAIEENTDADGYYNGEYSPVYGVPTTLRINVSAERGSADMERFGIDTPYTKTLVTDDTACPIKEDSVLWIDKTPDDGDYNYVVVRVARSLNFISYAVREVNYALEAVNQST